MLKDKLGPFVNKKKQKNFLYKKAVNSSNKEEQQNAMQIFLSPHLYAAYMEHLLHVYLVFREEILFPIFQSCCALFYFILI